MTEFTINIAFLAEFKTTVEADDEEKAENIARAKLSTILDDSKINVGSIENVDVYEEE